MSTPLWISLAGGALAGALLTTALARLWRRARARRRIARGLRGERRAMRLLERRGYRVIAEQVEGGYTLWVDGEPQQIALRADALVSRRGRTYLVEVKTGNSARATERNTRRQLLEYAHAFECDGLILADMERELLARVDLAPPRTASRRARGAIALLVGALLLLAALAAGWLVSTS
ncbi:MAG: hypothetical protein KC503_18555 [Myxococcales bacterium]|nr:hypothetical protein [Myxococcales bacterium]